MLKPFAQTLRPAIKKEAMNFDAFRGRSHLIIAGAVAEQNDARLETPPKFRPLLSIFLVGQDEQTNLRYLCSIRCRQTRRPLYTLPPATFQGIPGLTCRG